MGRMMPMECEHGVTVDDGDFGPCQDCSEHERGECPNFHPCEQCEAERARWARVLVEDARIVLRLVDDVIESLDDEEAKALDRIGAAVGYVEWRRAAIEAGKALLGQEHMREALRG